MSLWVDSHRPKSLNELTFHEELNNQLQKLSEIDELPHLLFYGPSGAGKKTRINALLKGIFGDNIEKVHIDMRQFTNNNRKFEISVLSSNFHMEINPSDVGTQDRLIIQTLIKEIAQTQQVDANSKRKFKVIVIYEADALSKAAQQALRRTMEKYMSNLRLILCTNSTSSIISPVRSRCLLLRVPAPTELQIIQVLNNIAVKEEIDLPEIFAEKLAKSSSRNLRRAILMLESSLAIKYPLDPNAKVQLTDWEEYIKLIGNEIMKDQSPSKLLEIRTRFYELLVRCISPTTILKTLTLELLFIVPEKLKGELVFLASNYERRMREGQKHIVHLEGFTAAIMSKIKRFNLDSY